ncbi:hypothetical protein [Flavihumibacter sp. UBA7668]|uniref:hypothetical protein n=1 Tax=Flavihumibacter sp. UBA7668 TaxID=1946542 RepID=UPI0025BDCC2A|nr:hypothetical protein [Flavihumibacter sp. UBA7668]
MKTISTTEGGPLQLMGKAILMKRHFRKITMETISLTTNLHQSIISRLEKGDPTVPIGALHLVLKELSEENNLTNLAGDISFLETLEQKGLLKRPRKRKLVYRYAPKPSRRSV